MRYLACLVLLCGSLPLLGSLPWDRPTYAEQSVVAEKTGKPLVVGVRCDPPLGAWLTCRTEVWSWGEGSFLVVSVKGFGEDLPADSSPLRIERKIKTLTEKLTAPAPTTIPARVPPALKVQQKGLHSHRCSWCGNVWSHGQSSQGRIADHICPACGKGPTWTIHEKLSTLPVQGNIFFNDCPTGT